MRLDFGVRIDGVRRIDYLNGKKLSKCYKSSDVKTNGSKEVIPSITFTFSFPHSNISIGTRERCSTSSITCRHAPQGDMESFTSPFD